ncbi:MAG TPA: hypothetical protein VNS83_05750 [Lapillicoccus sp.]|nr:hypothetical protein [Lapillicoccus sp.]
MIDGATGDPGSCSQLGGALRSNAARLLTLRTELTERMDRLRRDPAEAATVADLDAHLRLLDATVDRLDAGGAALQRFAQELAEIAESARRLEGSVQAAGLVLDGLRVVEPWGVLTTELAQQRNRAQPQLQRRADRLASQLGRARTVTARAMTEGAQALAAAARVSRTRSLR